MDAVDAPLVQVADVRRVAGQVDHRGVPARVDDPQVLTLEGQGELAEEAEDLGPGFRVGGHLGDDPAGAVERLGLAVKPGVAVLLLAAQQVQLVVPQHALGAPGLHESTHQGDDRGAVRPPVGQVAEEDQSPPLGMPSSLVIAEPERGAT